MAMLRQRLCSGSVWMASRKYRCPSIIVRMSSGCFSRLGDTSGMSSGLAERSLTVPRDLGFTTTVVMVKHLNEPPVPPRDRVATVHGATERVVLKMLAKAPKDRYQTPAELLDDLEGLRADRTGGAEHGEGFHG